MAHLIKLNVLDPSHDGNPNTRTYIPNLINLDMVVNMEPSKIHTLLFMKGNQQPIRIRESLDEVLHLSKGCGQPKILNG